jgi:16S rRNA (cytosine1402-N4)-methyltransferase
MAFRGMRLEYPHQPVLVREVVKYLVTLPGGIYVDGTVGSGGHSVAVGKSLLGKGRLICLDRDPEAVRLSGERLDFLGNSVCVKKANFVDLDKVLKNLGFREVQGVLLDLGMSSYQIEKSGRGFSFSRNEPLDMRMDPDETLTAGHLVNNLSSKELERILRDFGEERRAKLIARAIVSARSRKPIDTSLQLAVLTKSVLRSPSRRSKTQHPATRTFQALRIAVNRELENLEVFLKKIPLLMAKGGRLVVLSYHSLEDRLVKQAMFDWEKGCTCPPDFPKCMCVKVPIFRRLIKKGLKPSTEEIEDNPRARSARLRAAERI